MTSLKWIIENFKPTWKARLHESWFKANGLTRLQSFYLQFNRQGICYICGRTLKPLQEVEFIPIYDNEIKYVCSDHGGEWWDVSRGIKVTFSHKPYYQRRIREVSYIDRKSACR